MFFFLYKGEAKAIRFDWMTQSGLFIAFLFLLGVLPPAYAQTHSTRESPSATSSTTQASLTRLLAVDARREVAVFEDAQGKMLTVRRGQTLPGSNERLTRVFVDSVELTRQDERQPLMYFLKTGESLSVKRAEALEAIASKNRPIPQITIHSMPIPETDIPTDRSSHSSP